jgi:DNA-binding MarR family transcriptional regulator
MKLVAVDLSSLLCYRLFSVVRANEQLIDKHMAPLHLNRTQWKVIARFNFLPMPCTQQHLLASMGIDRAHLTRTLEQLEQKSLIKKDRQLSDKRAYTIGLTQKGQVILQEVEKILKLESASLEAGLSTAEKMLFKELIDKIETNILHAL